MMSIDLDALKDAKKKKKKIFFQFEDSGSNIYINDISGINSFILYFIAFKEGLLEKHCCNVVFVSRCFDKKISKNKMFQ